MKQDHKARDKGRAERREKRLKRIRHQFLARGIEMTPVENDLDTAAMFCGMSRRVLRGFLRANGDKFTYSRNRLTLQRFLTGDDIRLIRDLTIEQEPTTDYDTRARNLPAIRERLKKAGLGVSFDHGEGDRGDGENGVRGEQEAVDSNAQGDEGS